MTTDPTLDPEYHRGRLLMLAELVRDMRAAQKEYFDPERRKPDTLRRCLSLERRVDERLTEILGLPGQQTLF